MDIREENIISSPLKYVDFPHCDLWSFVESSFVNNRNAVALVDPIKEISLTFGELYDHVTCIASSLVTLGYNRESPLVIYMNNCVEFVMVTLAVWRLGGSVSVINHLLTVEEISKYLELLDGEFLLCSQETASNTIKAGRGSSIKRFICTDNQPGCLLFSQLCQTPTEVAHFPEFIDPKETAIMVFSSGTTGPPKCVGLPHGGLAASVNGLNEGIGLNNLSNGGIICQPMSHGYAFLILLCLFRCGQKVIVMSRFDLEAYLAYIHRYRLELLFLVPPIAVMMCKSPLVQQYDLSSVKRIVCGAAPLGKDSEQELKKILKYRPKVMQGYGLTETCLAGCLVLHYDNYAPTGSIGVPYPNTAQAKIVDLDTGKNLGPNKSGELCFKSTYFMNGYLKNPKATADMIRDGWIHTGDIAYYDNNGYFFIVDRLKELIKYKGYQVAPSELETVLLTHPGVADAGVTSVPDQEAGELPQAWVVLKPGVSLSTEEIQAFVAGKVAPFKRLRGGVKIVEVIPKTPSGKIMRRLMKQQNIPSRL